MKLLAVEVENSRIEIINYNPYLRKEKKCWNFKIRGSFERFISTSFIVLYLF